MFFYVIFIVIITQLPQTQEYGICAPNSSFLFNNIRCVCVNGRWNNNLCSSISANRRYQCLIGQVIRHGCVICVCDKDGKLVCNNASCATQALAKTVPKTIHSQGLSTHGTRCIPLQRYYINCSICICAASGRTIDSQCAVDLSCPFSKKIQSLKDILNTTTPYQCMPKGIYLFPCLQCICSERGIFVLEKCMRTCQMQTMKPIQRCIPGTIHRTNCNICRCPENGIPDQRLCGKLDCDKNSSGPKIMSLKNVFQECMPYAFTALKCLFCDCNVSGVENENVCYEINCSKMTNLQSNSRSVCSLGDSLPVCMECFCLPDGINIQYCSKNCSSPKKLYILEKFLNDSSQNSLLLLKNEISNVVGTKCPPSALYLYRGRYCLCTEYGNVALEYCTSVFDYSEMHKLNLVQAKKIEIDFNKTCRPSTLVEFDCNTCFCSKNGKIDPKWCTYDDCEAKKVTQELHKSKLFVKPAEEAKESCTPGSISIVKCNFCVCPESGNLSERVCTKNDCFEVEDDVHYKKFTCEPLTYYEVDCNICYCPRDGLKNVAKCTKNHCESNFLRSDYCVPGQLFSNECNVCICPLNGNKEERACTNHNCDISPWNIYKIPQTLLGDHIIHDNTKRSLDICFPGEEFTKGCEVCLCPEMGLQKYATCEKILCEDNNPQNFSTFKSDSEQVTIGLSKSLERPARRDVHGDCLTINRTDLKERAECTPGTMYIIRCKQCICPYQGNINNFCRPLPKKMYCEQAYPGFNYLPMGRRVWTGTSNTSQESTLSPNKLPIHHHTKHKCEQVGRLKDPCFICECETGNVLIEEHCFKSDATYCITATPSFLKNNTFIHF